MGSIARKVSRLRYNEYYDIQRDYDRLYNLSERNYEFKDLLTLICDERNIGLAFRNIKNNKGSKTPGVDGKTISHYEGWSKEKLVTVIRNELNNYKPSIVRRVDIPNPNGKTRPLGIPCVLDRIIQQCILQVLEPICEAKFHKHSYGFRPNRSAENAIARATSLINLSKLHYVVDVHIEGFFDNIDHSKLLKQIWSMGIRDKRLICIIGKMLKCEVMGYGIQRKGTPQGGILSPLLSNIVLNEFDWWISDQWETFEARHNYVLIRNESNGRIRYDRSGTYRALKKNSKLKEMFIVRYADDFKIFCRDYKTANKCFEASKLWLGDRLKLNVNPEKSKITNIRKGKTEFLGFVFKGTKKGRNKIVCHSHISEKAKKHIINDLIEQIKCIQKSQDLKNIQRYNGMVLGYHNYYNKATNIAEDMRDIDYRISVILQNRLNKYFEKQSVISSSYRKLYGNYKFKVRSIKRISLFPIGACKTKNCKSFNQDVCNYSEYGRSFKHKNINDYNHYVRHLLSTTFNDNVELADNKIALIYGQKGLCYVTGKPLVIGDMECHHKIPRFKGGTDKYNNLVWVSKDVHKLIHAKDENTINAYLDKIKLSKNARVKVNLLRRTAENLDI